MKLKRIYYFVPVTLLGCTAAFVAACSGDDITSQPGVDAGKTDGTVDSSTDTSTVDSNTADTNVVDSTCPSSWTMAPVVDPSLEPDGSTLGAVVLHGEVLSGDGTQDYECLAKDDAGVIYQWTLVGPEAQLSDCHGSKYVQHFASDGGATRPEWFSTGDNSYLVGKKLAAFTPDGGSGSVPWLLLQEVSNGGTGPISTTKYVHRVNTGAGNPPDGGCALLTDADGGVVKIPYTADYYFYGP